MSSSTITKQREEAWVGDAVLCLYARTRILREQGRLDANQEKLLTSNRFLNGYSHPTEAEACIGRRFNAEGLAAAFQWIRDHLEPIFDRQEANRLKAGAKPAAQKRSRRRR